MHVSTTTRRSGDREYTATLLRRSYREDGKVKKETLANLSHLPPEAIDAIRRVLAGETLMTSRTRLRSSGRCRRACERGAGDGPPVGAGEAAGSRSLSASGICAWR